MAQSMLDNGFMTKNTVLEMKDFMTGLSIKGSTFKGGSKGKEWCDFAMETSMRENLMRTNRMAKVVILLS